MSTQSSANYGQVQLQPSGAHIFLPAIAWRLRIIYPLTLYFSPQVQLLLFCPPSSSMTTVLEQPTHDASVMCRYPSKKCWNPRAHKRNGERHNLCDFHRQKANKNQRRLELKRKARAQAFTDLKPAGKRLRTQKKTRQRARRMPLSAHLAMKEEARIEQQAREVSRATELSGWFTPDLELPLTPAQLPRLPDVVDEETLEHILQDGQAIACHSLDSATSGPEALASMSEGKTSPVDVGESWDNLELSDQWLPADHPGLNFDVSAFVMDDHVYIADV